MSESDFIASSALLEKTARSDSICATVVRYGHPIQRALRFDNSEMLAPVDSAAILSRTQDLEPTWHDAGQFYWATPSRWHDPTPLLSRVIPYEVPHWRVQDLDSEDDWIRAEIIFDLTQRLAGSWLKQSAESRD